MIAIAIVILLMLLTTFVALWQREYNQRTATELRCRQLVAILAITDTATQIRTRTVLRTGTTPTDTTRFLHLELRS